MTAKTPLATAAATFEHDLMRYDELAVELAAMPLSSQKSLARATKLLEEAAACEQRLGHDVEMLMTAMQGARNRQQGAAEKTLDVARRIESRMAEHAVVMQRFVALAERAKRATQPVADLVEGGNESTDGPTLKKRLGDAQTEMNDVVAEAERMIAEAAQAGWQDVVREADSLKQKLMTTRNRVALAHRKVSEKAPV